MYVCVCVKGWREGGRKKDGEGETTDGGIYEQNGLSCCS